jgi:hypothetical protein
LFFVPDNQCTAHTTLLLDFYHTTTKLVRYKNKACYPVATAAPGQSCAAGC